MVSPAFVDFIRQILVLDADDVLAMSPFPTAHLAATSLFRSASNPSEDLDVASRIDLSHERAKHIVLSYNLTLDDVLRPTQKFWDLHADPICTVDIAAYTLLSIQVNLAAGTIAPFAVNRPELRKVVDDLLQFRANGQFLLTELGHGLDARRLETTVTMLPDGTFDLHTPNDQAAKYMPPTLPRGNVPRLAIVMARLIVRNEDRGVRPFVVPINDGREMCTGVTARQLPTRHGSNSVGHALTSFNHVKLPFEALLGSLDMPRSERLNFLRVIWRVNLGTLALTSIMVPALRTGAYIAARYSQRRHVGGADGLPVPIISFRTQQAPILQALAQSFVLDAFLRGCTAAFTRMPRDDLSGRNALATVFKVVTMKQWQRSMPQLADRCGAQGLFGYNKMVQFESELRGVGIAEGDTLVLSIRLASELLLGRYALPAPEDRECLLAKREAGLFAECRAILSQMKNGHRSDAFNQKLLPRSLPLIEAIGQRMAYEAAVAARIPQPLLRLYEANCVAQDMAWYVESGLLSRQDCADREDAALTEALAGLDEYLRTSGVQPYADVPILTQDSWDAFLHALPSYEGKAKYTPIPIEPTVHVQAHL